MLKKVLAVTLALALIICCFAGCKKSNASTKEEGKASVEINVPTGKKVTIITASADEYPEDYLAATAIAQKYPDIITVKTLEENSHILKAGNADIITAAQEAAEGGADAVIFARATLFATEAINAVNFYASENNKTIITAAIEPEQNLDTLAASLIVACNWEAAATDIVNTAVSMGAKSFMFFSNARLNRNSAIDAETKAFEAACAAASIKFIPDTNCKDPINAEGIDGAKLVIREQVNQFVMNNKIDENTALFSTDSTVQTALVECCAERNMIYVSPSLPSAYSGVSEFYNAQVGEKWYNVSDYIKAISATDAANGKFAVYGFGLIKTMIYGSVYAVFDKLCDEKADLSEQATLRMTDVAETESFTCTDCADMECDDVVSVYASGFFTKIGK